MFVNKEQNEAGIFAINAYIRGKPTIITVDDYVPYHNDSPIFAKLGKDGALWGVVLEKVWAKISGTYERMELGIPLESMRFLTGAPVRYYDINYLDAKTAWDIISQADQNHFIIIAGTTGASDTTTNSYGIANSHSFTLVGAYTVKSKTGEEFKLFKIRNPWRADGPYNGKWRDNDPIWNQEDFAK